MQADVVFFDAGGTLIYAEPPVGEVYAQALRQTGINADGAEVQRRFEEAWRRLRRQHAAACSEHRRRNPLPYGRTEAEAKDWWRRVVRESFEPFGRPDDFEAAFLYLWDHFASGAAWRLYEDVLPTFDALERKGKGIGLISNWDVRLPGLLEQLGLSKRIRWPVVSCHVGAEKPHPSVFLRAAEASGLPPGRLLHVGDSYAEDVLGATRAGMGAIWLRRPGERGGEPEPPADGLIIVRSLREVVALLD